MSRSFEVRRTALAAALSASFGAAALAFPQAAHAASWVNTATQAIPLNGISGLTPLAASQQLHVVVGLTPRNKTELDALVAAIGKPGSPQFGHTITPAQFLASYAPTSDQAEAVVSYLNSMGFSNVQLSANRLTVSAYGAPAVVESAFNTKLVSFLSAGKTVFANSAPAQVPASLAGIVSAVVGLENLGTMQTPLLRTAAVRPALPTAAVQAAAEKNIGVPSNLTSTYTPANYQAAYDVGSTSTGWGTTIGIVAAGDLTQVPKDLRTFEAQNSLPQVPYEIVPTGVQTTSTSGLDEWDLDSQSSSGIAGNLREIIFYNPGSLADADLIPAYEKIVSDNRVKAVNMSYGGCEELEYLSGGMLLADLAYEQGSAEGMTFFAAAGDGGASCQLLVNAGQPGVLGAVEYPASSEYTLSVGGTSLFTNSDFSYDFEISWISGGGGVSQFESPGAWTSGIILPTSTELGDRGVPDMAMVGDPNFGGASIVVNGASEGVGGTSLSSPMALGSWARMQTAHGNCYGFAPPILYGTFGQSYGTAALDYHDIVVGFNFLYTALPGWDYTTGLGTFDIAAVNGALPAVSCPPEAPVNAAAGLIDGQVLVSWGPSAGATSYAVYAGTASGAEGTAAVATSSSNSAVISGLKPGKTYYFTVEAVNSSGSSAASNEVSVAIPLPPAAPTGLTATAGNAQATLSWKASSAATSYEVFQGTTSGGEKSVPVATGISGTSTVISGLSNGSTYYFVVEASNSGGNSGKSNEAKATLAAAPGTPANVSAAAGSSAGKIVVSWSASSGAASYNVYAGTSSDGESHTASASATGTSATLSGLSSGQAYYFQVTAVSSDGAQSGKSEEASAVAP